MKKFTFMSSICLFSFALLGCHTMNSLNQAGGTVVGTGANLVTSTGRVVGSTVNRGAHFLTGYSVGPRVIYHNGHKYKLYNGRYVRVR